jgi:signal recognition particle subunit SRP19
LRKSDRVIIFPIYIDSSKTRGDGRKISRSKGVNNPKLSEIAEACNALGFNVIVEENASHPSESIERRGLIRAIKRGSKIEMLEKIALQIKRLRAEKVEKVKNK